MYVRRIDNFISLFALFVVDASILLQHERYHFLLNVITRTAIVKITGNA